MMRRGVAMPLVQHVIKRRLIAQARADFENDRVRVHKPEPEAVVFPEPGSIDWLFREARKLRA
jgi:hypothetical protein